MKSHLSIGRRTKGLYTYDEACKIGGVFSAVNTTYVLFMARGQNPINLNPSSTNNNRTLRAIQTVHNGWKKESQHRFRKVCGPVVITLVP